MYQITGNTISFRISPEERDILNQHALTMQTQENQVYTNSKQLVFGLITHCNQLESTLNTTVSKLNTDVDSSKSSGSETKNIQEVENTMSADVNNLNTELNADVNKVNAELNSDVIKTEFKNSSELLDLIEQAKMTIGYDPEDSPATPEAVLRDLIEIINQPIETPKAIEKEVTVEVERKLSPNEILVNLTAQQVDVLELIARWRFSKRLDQEKKTKAEIIKAMTFNEATLLNYGDCYKTGIKSKNIR